MEISTLQAVLIALYAGIAAMTQLPIMLLPPVFAMPMLVGPIVGLILGDVSTGLIVGISLELVWLGLTSIGGTVPPDKIVGTTLATSMVIVAGLQYEEALALVLPAALIGQALGIAVQTINSFFAHWADRFALSANFSGVSLTMWLGNLLLFLVRFVPVLLALTLGLEVTESFISSVPEWLTEDIAVGGALLPAVGFSLLLVMIMKRELWPWFMIGFVLAAALQLNTIVIAIFATAAALLIGYQKLTARASA
ncbi:MAG: PTS sugar transporter subunit IIC [Anaerolineales bacterium]|jgi:PTS system mannose-specific IIC component/fructoselysine and glucoselysine-specific PTS system IIC component